jgi:hypothetical protein
MDNANTGKAAFTAAAHRDLQCIGGNTRRTGRRDSCNPNHERIAGKYL